MNMHKIDRARSARFTARAHYWTSKARLFYWYKYTIKASNSTSDYHFETSVGDMFHSLPPAPPKKRPNYPVITRFFVAIENINNCQIIHFQWQQTIKWPKMKEEDNDVNRHTPHVICHWPKWLFTVGNLLDSQYNSSFHASHKSRQNR